MSVWCIDKTLHNVQLFHSAFFSFYFQVQQFSEKSLLLQLLKAHENALERQCSEITDQRNMLLQTFVSFQPLRQICLISVSKVFKCTLVYLHKIILKSIGKYCCSVSTEKHWMIFKISWYSLKEFDWQEERWELFAI